MDITMNMALTLSRPPQLLSQPSSLRVSQPYSMEKSEYAPSQFPLYKGVTERPLGWKRSSRTPELRSRNTTKIRRWNGAAKTSTEWDGLRKDPELFYPQGNCSVHLYGRGQSRRGPAFKFPIEALVKSACQPLIHRFSADTSEESSPLSDSSNGDGAFSCATTVLYIPAPSTAETGQAFLYHLATRNLFAWVFGKPLVGTHLGGALVGLLNSLNEFRSGGQDNLQAIIDYMDEEGYADMRNQPDHALAILFFAEHFQFKDLWIDAFAHCVGMNEKLFSRIGFELISRTSRALITRSRLEMDIRLDRCGITLGNFLEDDLSNAHLGLSTGERAHLDKFRSFLQSYLVAKLGYYPPSFDTTNSSFSKSIYNEMCSEFQSLYNFLANTSITSSDPMPLSQPGCLCVSKSVKSFDQRNKYKPLLHPVPLLPETRDTKASKPVINKRFTWNSKADKMKPDGRLVAFAELCKATDRKTLALYDCSLVREYCGFEKDCIFSPSKTDKDDKLSQTDARKVRWILIYTILQTLLSATKVPEQVRDPHEVSYNLCILTAGCPPWKEERPVESLLQTQAEQTEEDFVAQTRAEESKLVNGIKLDTDYATTRQEPQLSRVKSASVLNISSRKGHVKKTLSSLGNMPELHHPRPNHASYQEILVQGYGNGTNITAAPTEEVGKNSLDSASSFAEDISSRWSESSDEIKEPASPTTSIASDYSGRDSTGSNSTRKSISDKLNRPMSTLGFRKKSSTGYSISALGGESPLEPCPLQVRKGLEDQYMTVTKAVTVQWEDGVMVKQMMS
ncbi:hypothetical protein LSUB1_G007807 [Lachnellula subtilissima]|uniref:DUF8004 domain-containing protein n=1 Tax=Lachnellula subtilissima TaxID=602034 RepID=A0A8H8REZ6_9HELO|nr:hypothetical protein LSUB1_G007807 [Lachnellula subtilissima]